MRAHQPIRPDQLPLWLADTWVEASSMTEGSTGRYKKQLELLEALLEYLGMVWLSVATARRHHLTASARAAIGGAAAHAFGKQATFGDWVRLVQAGFQQGGGLLESVVGVEHEPVFGPGDPVFAAYSAIESNDLPEVPLTRLFAEIARTRNDFAHRRSEPHWCDKVVPLLGSAIDQVLAALPALRTRPLCQIVLASNEAEGFTVVYRPLVGGGRQADERALIKGPPASHLARNRLVFWDRAANEQIPVPEWLCSYVSGTHGLFVCQGTHPDRRLVRYHSRQPNQPSVPPAGQGDAFDQLWHTLADLGHTTAPKPVGHVATFSDTLIYSAAYRIALENDGQVSEDEHQVLNGVAAGLSLADEVRRDIEQEIIAEFRQSQSPPRTPTLARPSAPLPSPVVAPPRPSLEPLPSGLEPTIEPKVERRGGLRWVYFACGVAALAGAWVLVQSRLEPRAGGSASPQIDPVVAVAPAPPSTIEGCTETADAFAKRWMFREAADAYRLCIEAEADPIRRTELRVAASNLLFRGNFDSAARAGFQAAVAVSPNKAKYHNRLAWFLLTSTEPRDPGLLAADLTVALSEARRAVELTNRKHAGHLDTLAEALVQNRKMEEAKAVVQEILEKQPAIFRPFRADDLLNGDTKWMRLREWTQAWLQGKAWTPRVERLFKATEQAQLTAADIAGMPRLELVTLYNAIYARRGQRFGIYWMDSLFGSQPWYQARPEFKSKDLTPLDSSNIEFLKAAARSATPARGGAQGSEEEQASADTDTRAE